MEIHVPKAPHSWGEFLREIGTITLGILIALSLEALIEAARNHELVAHARANLREELQRNRDHLVDCVATARSSEAPLREFIAYGTDRLGGKPHEVPKSQDLSGTFVVLSTAAWEATGATQAIVHMRLSDAQVLERVYTGSRAFNALEEKVETRWFELAAISDDPEHMPDAELAASLGTLKVVLSYQQSVVLVGEVLLKGYDQTLHQIGS